MMVAAEGSPKRKRPKPTPTLTCFMALSPAMLSHERMVFKRHAKRSYAAKSCSCDLSWYWGCFRKSRTFLFRLFDCRRRLYCPDGGRADHLVCDETSGIRPSRFGYHSDQSSAWRSLWGASVPVA